jgi:hypothetical protein
MQKNKKLSRWALLIVKKSFAHAICGKFMDEALMIAFVFNICLTFHKVVSTRDDP